MGAVDSWRAAFKHETALDAVIPPTCTRSLSVPDNGINAPECRRELLLIREVNLDTPGGPSSHIRGALPLDGRDRKSSVIQSAKNFGSKVSGSLGGTQSEIIGRDCVKRVNVVKTHAQERDVAESSRHLFVVSFWDK